jgi:hypothetical protein
MTKRRWTRRPEEIEAFVARLRMMVADSGVKQQSFVKDLGGVNRYPYGVETRPGMGDGRAVRPDDVPAAVRLSLDVGAALAVGLAAAGAAGSGRARRPVRLLPT